VLPHYREAETEFVVERCNPEDFKLHELRTMGTAKGTNEIITYVSLKTGLVFVRATEETSQFMDVIVAQADGSNRVHYNVDAKSHSEVLLITETPLNHPDFEPAGNHPAEAGFLPAGV